MFLNILYNINYLECKEGIATKFVNILRYNPNINSPCMYHLKIVKEGNGYIFYKDANSKEVSGEEKIKEEIKKINNELSNNKHNIEYENIFYMTEINEVPFFRDKDYLLSHDLCDIPGLSEYTEENRGNEDNKIDRNEINNEAEDNELSGKLKKGEEDFWLVINKKENEEKVSYSRYYEIEVEDDIFYDINIENENSYTTKIFNIIKTYIDGAIIVLNIENFYYSENFHLIAKLHKVTQKKINNFLIILNKTDLSQNPDQDIEKCKGLLIKYFPKCKTFNINLNTFIAISTFQLQNELLMSKEFKYLINYHYFNYASKIKKTNNQENSPLGKTFINHLANILTFNGIKKEEIEKRVEELDNSEKIDQINQELQSIVKNLKNYFQNFEINVGVTEEDFNKVKSNNLLDDDEEAFQINNDENIKPSYVLKILYILHQEKKLIPSFSKETNKILDFFTNNKEIQLFEESKPETTNIRNMNKFEIMNSLDILLQAFKESKIDINEINSLIDEISLTIQYLKNYEFIYIPFLGPSNSGKSTLINGIIGKDILPTNMGECTKRGIIIKYSNSDEIIIRKANFKELNIFRKKFYYFEPDNIIGKGIKQVKETLNSLNFDFSNKKEDYFYYISTKIKLFDDIGLDEQQKNMIYLIDFPGYGTKNVSENEINKVMSICNSFIFVVKNSVIKENKTQKILNQIFTQAKEQKKKSSSQYAKSCLFVFNNEQEINPTDRDIDIAKSDIQNIINGLEKDSINLCFFNAKYYSSYCSNLNYFFNLKTLFSNEFKNFSYYNNSGYIDPIMININKYKTFCDYFLSLIRQKIKKLGFKSITSQNDDEKVKNEIDEIFNEYSKLKNFNNDDKNKDIFIKLISFVRENINNAELIKKSNINELKSCFSLQIFFANEDIQKYIIEKIDEITSMLDLFFRKDITEREKDLKEKENLQIKMGKIQNSLFRNLGHSANQIFDLINTFKKNVNNSLKNKEAIIVKSLKSKNFKPILKEIYNEIKNNLKQLNEQIKNFLDESEKQPLELYNEANSIIQKFSDGKVSFPKLSTFREKFAKGFGNNKKIIDDEIFNEIKIAIKDLNKFYEKHGFQKLFISVNYNGDYLKNVYDIILNTFIDRINYLLKLIIERYEEYINYITALISNKVKSTNIQFNKEQKKNWDKLSKKYEDIRSSIIDIKFKINDEIYITN